MADHDGRSANDKQAGRFLGSLREALAAASRDDTGRGGVQQDKTQPLPMIEAEFRDEQMATLDGQSNLDDGRTAIVDNPPPLPSAAEAALEARGGTPNIPPVEKHVEFDAPPTTRVVKSAAADNEDEVARTQLVRGKQDVERGEFLRDPVVGWLVVVGGPGIGAYRPIHEGNNAVGRSKANRIAIDFGDDAISSEEQAYVRYDSTDRTFLFVPNMAKTNVVSVNDKRPTSAVLLQSMDVITMGRTQLVFVAFCGPEFDWSELNDLRRN
ncbi:MAG: FHA domain-containing protein [Hyphomicrobiaceae bacterium]